MFRCTVCGSIGQSDKICGVCGRSLHKTPQEPSPSSAVPGIRNLTEPVHRQQSKPHWTTTTIVALTVVVLVAISTVATGMYYSATRPLSPACRNGAVNFPSCDSCGRRGAYSPASKSCYCTNGTVNPPSCNVYCIGGAINPPRCDICPSGTDVHCGPPTAEVHAVAVDPGSDTSYLLASKWSAGS